MFAAGCKLSGRLLAAGFSLLHKEEGDKTSFRYNEVTCSDLSKCIEDMLSRLRRDDLMKGACRLKGHCALVWVDASDSAIGCRM